MLRAALERAALSDDVKQIERALVELEEERCGRA
jgi:hypothetical protein